MLKKIKIGFRLGIGFGLLLSLFTSLILFSINRMEFLSNFTNLMYKHPLTVSNAVLRVDANIVRIHRSMKDVALAENLDDIDGASLIVDIHEKEIFKDFDIINERFLGEKKMYQNALNAFSAWKPIREEVIALMRSGKKVEAATITKGRG